VADPAASAYSPPAVPSEPTRTRFAEPPRPPAVPEEGPLASAQVDTSAAADERTQAPDADAEAPEPSEALDADAEADEPAPPTPVEIMTSAQVDTSAAEGERTQALDADGDADAAARPDRPVRLLVLLAGLLLVATTVLGALALVGAPSGSLSDVQRDSAIKAARADATKIFSFDYRHLDADFKAGLAVSTGTFKQEYSRTTTKLVQDLVPKYKAVTLAQVSTAGIVSDTKDSAIVLVFFNQQASSTLLKEPRVTQNRIEMTMVRNGDGWLVSKVKAL
jgi:Mce-associated membrane protein